MMRRLRLELLRAIAALRRPPVSVQPTWLPRRVLVIRPDHIGDLLFATPALRALRTALPHAHIACLAGPWAADVVARHPDVDEIITCSFPWFSRQPKGWPWSPYRQLFAEATRIKAMNFDLALNLRFDFWWGAALAYLAGIPQRVGYDTPECHPFLSEAPPYAPGYHEVRQNLRLVSHLVTGAGAAPQDVSPIIFPLRPDELAFAAARLGDGDWVALHPGAGAPIKRWRSEAFAALGNSLADRFGVRIVITGTAAETDLVEAIRHQMTSPSLALTDASLGQLGAIYRHCRLVVGVDSGAMHLAAAVDAPTVHLYGPVATATFGPWGNPLRHRVVVGGMPCVPCNRLDYADLDGHPCIRDIPLEPVLAAVTALLGSAAP